MEWQYGGSIFDEDGCLAFSKSLPFDKCTFINPVVGKNGLEFCEVRNGIFLFYLRPGVSLGRIYTYHTSN